MENQFCFTSDSDITQITAFVLLHGDYILQGFNGETPYYKRSQGSDKFIYYHVTFLMLVCNHLMQLYISLMQ